MNRFLCLILAMVMTVCLFTGCDAVGEIAGNVLDAAKDELTQQIEEKLEEYKVEVVQIKPVAGKINDDGGKLQFFCAALVQSNSESSVQDCTKALKKVFKQADYKLQSEPEVDRDELVHKTITFDHEDYSDGNYYTVCVYVPAVDEIIDLDALADKIKK